MLKYYKNLFTVFLKSEFAAEAAEENYDIPETDIDDLVLKLGNELNGEDLETLDKMDILFIKDKEKVSEAAKEGVSNFKEALIQEFKETLHGGMRIENKEDFKAFVSVLKKVEPSFELNFNYEQVSNQLKYGDINKSFVLGYVLGEIRIYEQGEDSVNDKTGEVTESGEGFTKKIEDGSNQITNSRGLDKLDSNWSKGNDNKFDQSNIQKALKANGEKVDELDAEITGTTDDGKIIVESLEETEGKLSYAKMLLNIDGYIKENADVSGGYTLKREGGKIYIRGNGHEGYFTVKNSENKALSQDKGAFREWAIDKVNGWKSRDAVNGLKKATDKVDSIIPDDVNVAPKIIDANQKLNKARAEADRVFGKKGPDLGDMADKIELEEEAKQGLEKVKILLKDQKDLIESITIELKSNQVDETEFNTTLQNIKQSIDATKELIRELKIKSSIETIEGKREIINAEIKLKELKFSKDTELYSSLEQDIASLEVAQTRLEVDLGKAESLVSKLKLGIEAAEKKVKTEKVNIIEKSRYIQVNERLEELSNTKMFNCEEVDGRYIIGGKYEVKINGNQVVLEGAGHKSWFTITDAGNLQKINNSDKFQSWILGKVNKWEK